MWDQEKEHKAKFEELIPKYRARPTALLPLWNVAGYVLGAGKWVSDHHRVCYQIICVALESWSQYPAL